MVIYAMKITEDGESLRFEEMLTGDPRGKEESTNSEIFACKVLRDNVKKEIGKWISEATGNNIEMQMIEGDEPTNRETLGKKLERSVKKLLEIARREDMNADDIIGKLPPFEELRSSLDEVMRDDDIEFKQKEELVSVAVVDWRMGRLVGMMAVASLMFGDIDVKAG